MGELGYIQDVIDRCLDHKEPEKVARTYQRQTMLTQRQAAFRALGRHPTSLLGDPADWLPWPHQHIPDVQSADSVSSGLRNGVPPRHASIPD